MAHGPSPSRVLSNIAPSRLVEGFRYRPSDALLKVLYEWTQKKSRIVSNEFLHNARGAYRDDAFEGDKSWSRTVASMDELKALSLTPKDGWRLIVFGFIIWTIGATLEGASALAILVVPLVLALWVRVALAVDRWVRNGNSSMQ